MRANLLATAVMERLERGQVPGGVVGVWCEGEVGLVAFGATEPDGGTAMTVDVQFRVSSNTKPIVAALTLLLAEDGVLALDDPVDRFIPELADRRVLRRPDSDLDDTILAERQPTVEDLLKMQLGFGFEFEFDCAAVNAAAEAGLGLGPPDPSLPLTPDEWIARFAELPLLEQPGTVWRYELAYALLGVLLARAANRNLGSLLRERLFDPLGMAETAFVAPPGRLPTAFAVSGSGLAVFDDVENSRWTRSPSFPDARGGLVSTAADLLRFARMLLQDGAGLLPPEAAIAMTTDHLTPEQRAAPSAQAFLNGSGWGYGVEVVKPAPGSRRLPRYGWGGGLGTLWYSWPEQNTAAVLLTQVLPPSPELIASFTDSVESAMTK